jgi:hypothetical protein
MTAFVPLFQTILWVGLIVWLIFRYHHQVVEILKAVQDRIIKGSSVKAGPFELGEDIRPQDVEEQNKRIEQEVQQIEEDRSPPATSSEQHRIQPSRTNVRKRYLLAEDLVMRELQSEFDAVMNRSVRFSDIELDGMFAKDGAGFGVEVKYVSDRFRLDQILQTLDGLQRKFHRFGWRRFSLILAMVCESEDVLTPAMVEKIQDHASKLGLCLMTRVYSLTSLSAKFGIDLEAE